MKNGHKEAQRITTVKNCVKKGNKSINSTIEVLLVNPPCVRPIEQRTSKHL